MTTYHLGDSPGAGIITKIASVLEEGLILQSDLSLVLRGAVNVGLFLGLRHPEYVAAILATLPDDLLAHLEEMAEEIVAGSPILPPVGE